MQKKIIALAIAGLSSAAFAQSTVTVSGNLDMGYYGQSIQNAGTMDTKDFRGNGSSTSTLTFSGTEDLGGGMKAGFQLGNDFAAGAVNAATNTLLQGESFLSLGGGWGTIKIGDVNTAALGATMGAQPYGTGIGSGISGAFGRLSGAGVNGGGAAGATAGVNNEGQTATSTSAIAGTRSVRANNSFKYDTPSFSGFSGSLQYAVKNTDAAVLNTGNTAGLTALGLAYNNGPINVYYVNEQTAVGAVAAPSGGINNPLPNANSKITHNILSGNYTFGPATVYAGWTSSKASGAPTTYIDARSWNLAVKYAVTGALTLGLNIVKVDDKVSTTDADRNVNALGLDYALSKRTTAYGRYESGDNDRGSITGNSNGSFSRYQIGMRHTF